MSKIDNKARQREHDQYLSMVGQPRRRVLVDTSEIFDEIVSQMATQILLYEEKTRGKNRIRKLLEDIREPKFNLSELVEVIKQDVENAYKADFAYLHGPDVQLGEENLKEIEDYKLKAVTHFLERIRREFSEEYLQRQVDKLAVAYNIEHLKPKPEPDADTMKAIEELQQEATATIERIRALKREIADAKCRLDQLWRLEVEALRGTSREGHSQVRVMIFKEWPEIGP
ncbi:hypothetical protein GFC01_00795 [Desulfofundulus thermobenzoicus]|uniref:Uncharacterized protein n=1 Tax=Desulfofundulus thermobenzoicus TaxID=29376 RepID=A0A6N7IMK5_9FIRM|nr:hypothetical protein [Desulfofundulus thermobenzoicus]MQL50837.1 hypothetical protein [Desulfofundulus thermobenzoicus]